MEAFAGGYLIFIIAISIFAIGSFLALPWIWYHTGHTSRKLSRIIELLEKDTRYDLSDDSVFRGLSKEEAIEKCRGNPSDKRTLEQIVAIWEKVNKTINSC
jgi:hypothetical protein